MKQRLATAKEAQRKAAGLSITSGLADLHYYKVLSVTSQASDVEIKRAYRQLALRHHPDKVSQCPSDSGI